MNSVSGSKKVRLSKGFLTKVIALVVGGMGVYTLWGVWSPLIFPRSTHSFSIYIYIIFPLTMSCVAVYFLDTAKKLWQPLSSRGLQQLSMTLSLIFYTVIFYFTRKSIDYFFEDINSLTKSQVELPLLMLLTGLFYLAVKRCLFKWFSLSEELDYKRHRRATKYYFGFMSYFTYSAVFIVIDESFQGHPVLFGENWGSGLILLIMIPVAYMMYRIGLHFFLKNPPNEVLNDAFVQAS